MSASLTHGPADEVAVVGDCEAVFLGTGADVDSWALVEQRGVGVTLTPGGEGGPGVAGIVTFRGVHMHRTLELERGDDGRYRFRVVDPPFVASGDWFELGDGDEINVRIDADTGVALWQITTNVGFETDHVLIEPSPTGTDLLVQAQPSTPNRPDLAAIGLTLSATPGPPPRTVR